MKKRISLVIALAALFLAAIPFWAGCGGDDTGTTTDEVTAGTTEATETGTTTGTPTGRSTGTGASDDLEGQLSELEDLEATVTVTQNGETMVIWSQKQGNWRWQDPSDESSYVIYNKAEDKMWIVNGNTAAESSNIGGEGQAWLGMSPAAMVKSFTMLPGSQSGDTWKISMPGGGSVTIEFKGPQGLPTRMEVKTPGEADEVTEFTYKDVGNVSGDLFVLPSNVTVTAMPNAGGMGNVDIPDVSIPNR